MSYSIVIYIIIAAVIGAVAMYLFLSNKRSVEEAPSPNAEDKVSPPPAIDISKKAKAELEKLQAEKEALQQEIEKLKNKLAKLRALHADEERINDNPQTSATDIGKYKKQIVDLEDEVEELEDELDDVKKKIKQLHEEKSEVEISLEQSKKCNKEITNQLQKVQSDLEQIVVDNQLKESSLKFITKILKASPEQASVNSMYEKIDLMSNFITVELAPSIKDTPQYEEAKDLFDSKLKNWVQIAKKDWLNHKRSIAFIGEFSAGKTSIVNAILTQNDPNAPKLPVSTKATTAIPTYISGGVSTRFSFFTPDNTLKFLSEEDFKSVDKEMLAQVEGVSALIKYFIMAYKNPLLDKISILDTPGFNSNDNEDAQRTIEVINECDALFWVMDVNAGTINRASLKLLQKYLNRPLYVVINKVDTKAKSEVDKVEKLIKSTLENEGLPIAGIIRFSQKESVDKLMNTIGEVKAFSDTNFYLDEVNQILEAIYQDIVNELADIDKQIRENKSLLSDSQENFAVLLQEIEEYSAEAAGIPQWETHIFSSDRYEMDQEEGEALISLLCALSEEYAPKLREESNHQLQLSQKDANLKDRFEDKRKRKIQIENLKELFYKYKKDLK